MEFTTADELAELGGDFIQIKHNGGKNAPLSGFDHLVLGLHDRPTNLTRGGVSSSALKPLEKAWGRDLVQKVNDYGLVRADGGASEISKAIYQKLADSGNHVLYIGAGNLGRGVFDLNRPAETATNDFPYLPEEIAAPLLDIRNRLMEAIKIVTHGNLLGVVQPHTMASGNPTEEEWASLQALKPEKFDRKRISLYLDRWFEVYAAMCNRRGRDAVDLISGWHGDKEKFSHRNERWAIPLNENLSAAGIPAENNNPFGHIKGYPCTIITEWAKERDIPSVVFDVPRHLLLADSNETYDPMTFKPDAGRVEKIADAVVKTLH